MMKITLRMSGLLFGLVLWSLQAWAQPANDECVNAFNVVFAADETSVVKTNGDSRGATASSVPAIGSCSGTFYTDDTWYTFTTPSTFTSDAVAMRVYFGDGTSTDVPAIGMALYESCENGEEAIQCFSSSVPEDDRILLPAVCMLPGHTYALRIWSTGATTATEGTFRVGVYGYNYPDDNILWEEKFDSDPFSRGWNTFGVVVIEPDSSVNAIWDWLPDGAIQPGSFTPATTIPSETFCFGAIGVNSDFNDSWGTGAVGTGPVPTALNSTGSESAPATYVIESPAIYMGDWDVEGISVTFHQGVRTLNSDFLISYRNRNAGDPNWGSWVDFTINEDLVVNASPTFNVIRQFLPGAHEADSIQLKLTYIAHYYFWMVDDLRIVETECTNTRVQENFYAIAPWAIIPSNQVFDYPILADIYNAGACIQNNVTLNHTLYDTNGVLIHTQNNLYGSIGPDSLAENKLFNELVPVPSDVSNGYIGTYTLSQDLADFDSTDNTISYEFAVGGNVFALEDGFTRSITPAASNFEVGAPMSYAYGNYFHPVEDAKVQNITWGVLNPTEMEGIAVNVHLLQWTDTNGDDVASANERRFIGSAEYTFTGTEGDNAIISTVLENIDNPGADIILEGGFGYIAIIEYQAFTVEDPVLWLLASDARDYGATNLAFDQAFDAGLVDRKFYASVLGLSPDGNLAQIDYGVTAAGTFGFDVVPLVRIVVDPVVSTNEQLPLDNLISAYPNPATDQVQVKLEFTEAYSDVKLRLIDPLGRAVFSKLISQTVSQHVETIDVRHLSAGNYMLQVETPDGQRSVPVMVVK